MTANPGTTYWRHYLFALLPAILTVGGWQAAVWAFDYLACGSHGKDVLPCLACGVDLGPAIGFGLFWCQILSWICVPISGGNFLGVLVRQIAAHMGWQDLVLWPSANKKSEPGRGRYRRRTPDWPA